MTAQRDYNQPGFFYGARPPYGVAALPLAAGPIYYAPTRPVTSAVVQTGQASATILPVPRPGGGAAARAAAEEWQDDEIERGRNDEPLKSDEPVDIISGTDSEGNSNEPEPKRTRTNTDSSHQSKIAQSASTTTTTTDTTTTTTTAANNTSTTPAKRQPNPNGDELGSDLDDEDELAEDVDDENIADLILCQYEKISRVRTRWRGVLRAGVIHVNGSDFAFSRATVDFNW